MRSQSRVAAVLAMAAALLVGPGVLLAQDATPEAGMPAILQAYEDAWSSGDAAQVAALYTETATRDDVPSAMISHGRPAIEAFAAGLFKVDDDIVMDVTDGFVGENWAVAEWTYHGIQLASGKEVTFRGASVLELENGLISRESDYYDLPEMQQQIAAASGTPAP